MIKVKAVVTSKDRREFVDLPYRLYRGNEMWIPPLKTDEMKMLRPETNPAFSICDAQFWTAWKDGRCVGRIGAIINRSYNKKIGRQMGRFTRVEFEDDRQVSAALFATAEQWLKERGMDHVHGPLGFTNIDNQGLLIEGFDHLPSQVSVMHFPYYREHIESLGYAKEADWVEFRLKIEQVPEKASRLADIIVARNNLEVVHLHDKKQVEGYFMELFELLNLAFGDLPYVSDFNEEMILSIKKKYMSVIQPKYSTVILKEGKMVGFIVGLPSLSKALQKARGRLFPFGFIHITRALRHPEVVDLLLTGVDPRYQKLGLPAILINELQKTLIENEVRYVETTGMFETNLDGATHWKNYDHIRHKRRRCYVKAIQ